MYRVRYYSYLDFGNRSFTHLFFFSRSFSPFHGMTRKTIDFDVVTHAALSSNRGTKKKKSRGVVTSKISQRFANHVFYDIYSATISHSIFRSSLARIPSIFSIVNKFSLLASFSYVKKRRKFSR